MLKYEHIEFLNLLFGLPIIIIAIILHNKWRKASLRLFAEDKLIKRLTPTLSVINIKIKHTLLITIFILLVISLANPQIGTKMEEVKREGVDLIIAIDLSNSMLAEDIKPNRLARSKQAISRLIDKLEGDRIGLIVFAGEAYVQLPITTDYSAAKLFLSTVNTNIIPTQGTEIGKAIDLATNSFELENEQNKAIIIITDGESHDEKAIENTQNARSLNIFVHTLGMGLAKGGPIPVYDKYGNKKGFRKDKEGEVVISKLNEELLQEIAEKGEGIYVRANNSEAGLSKVLAEINKMEKKEIGTMVFTEHKDRFQIFICLSIVLLILKLFITNKRYTITNRINYNK